MTDIHQEVGFSLCRRALLVGTGGVSVAALLAACGGDASEPGQQSTTQQAASNAPTGGNQPTASASAGGGAAGALAKVSDLPVGGGKRVGSVLLVQPQSGVIKGFDARCPHQGTLVGVPENGVITCPLHFSQFNAEDGALKRGPATRGLTPIAVKVTGDEVVRA